MEWGPSALGSEKWELYHLEQDFSQARDVSNEYPEKLRELQELFWVNAEKKKILPLDDRFVERLSMTNSAGQERPNLTQGRKQFVYYAGAVGINESNAPNIKNRSHTITAKVHIPVTGGEGVLVAQGEARAGWSLYVNHAGQPVYTYSFAGQRTTVTGPSPLPKGDTVVRLDFKYDGDGRGKGGTATLVVNDQPVGQEHVPVTVANMFSLNETFDVGIDTKVPVGNYPRNYSFGGAIESVTIDLK